MSRDAKWLADRTDGNDETKLMKSTPQKSIGLMALVWLLATITIGLQSWIGDQTIYSRSLEQKREELHFAILANKAPGDAGWGAVGALSVQKRVGIVYLAEAIRKYTSITTGKIYKALDTVFLFVALLSLFFYLGKWLPDIYCLLGVLYFCTALPLTYFFQLFHPWDRLQVAIWIWLLWLVADRRFVILIFGLLASIIVKFDTVLLPFLYFLVHASHGRWRRTTLETLFLLILAFGTYVALGHIFPAPLDDSGLNRNGALAMLFRNAQTFADMGWRFPPLLVHALPVFLSLFFMRSKERFVWACVAFALGLNAVYLLFSHYEEVRAHLVILVLVLPSALLTVKRFLEPDDAGIGGRALPFDAPAELSAKLAQ